MADYEVWIAQFWHGINILPSVAESSVAVAVHCALVAAFLWAIATNPSRPWTIFSWKQLTLLVLFLVVLGSSGYAHYELFQPYMTSEPFSAEGGSLAGGIQHLRREGLRKAYPIEVFFYLMTVMAVIITHSVMRPWIGNDVKAFGAKDDPWYKGIMVMIGFLISVYYSYSDFTFQSGEVRQDQFEELLPFFLPWLIYVGLLFVLSVYMVVDGLMTATSKKKQTAPMKIKKN